MSMTRAEYLEFVFTEHLKVLRTEQKNAEVGSVVVFSGFYGRAVYTRNDKGTWDRELK